MKSSFFNSIILASILVFSVGCGKSSKSSGSNTGAYTNLYNPGLTQTSQQVLEKNTAWFNAAAEGQMITGTRTVIKTQYSANTTPTCTNRTFLGIPYTSCTYSSGSSSGTELSRSTQYLFQDGRAISAKGNAELNAIFSGTHGTLINAIDTGAYSSQMDFLRGDGTIVSFIIDRNYHSLLNPVRKSEISQSTKLDIITSIL